MTACMLPSFSIHTSCVCALLHVCIYLHSESSNSRWVERWVLLVLLVNQSVMGNETVGPSRLTPLQMGRVGACQSVSMWECNRTSIHEPYNHTNYHVTHQWVWQWEGPYLVVLPVRSELKPSGSELSLWSCGRELCTGSSWTVAGQDLHQKIQVAHWTRWKPTVPPLFQLDACNRINTWISQSSQFIPYSSNKKANNYCTIFESILSVSSCNWSRIIMTFRFLCIWNI